MRMTMKRVDKVNASCANGYSFSLPGFYKHGYHTLASKWDTSQGRLKSEITWMQEKDGAHPCVVLTLSDLNGEFKKGKVVKQDIVLKKKPIQRLVEYTFEYDLQKCMEIINSI